MLLAHLPGYESTIFSLTSTVVLLPHIQNKGRKSYTVVACQWQVGGNRSTIHIVPCPVYMVRYSRSIPLMGEG